MNSSLRLNLPDSHLKSVENLPVQNATQDEISDILKTNKTVAVIGMSKNPEKDAYKIPEYLIKNGFKVIPVNPTADEILGQRALQEAFRRPRLR